MKLLMSLFLFLVSITFIKGQDIVISKKPILNIIDIDTLTGIKNKRLVFKYDTLYIINAYGVSEFMRCASDLNKIKNLSKSVDDLSIYLSGIENDVELMHSNIKSFTGYITDYQKETGIKLDSISSDNKNLNKNMELISKELKEVNNKIKAERRSSIGSKALYGAGGIIAGGLIFMLVSN